MPTADTSWPETAEDLKPVELSTQQWAELELEHHSSFTVTNFSSIASLWAGARKTLAHHRTPSHLHALPLGTTHLWDVGGGTFLMTIEASADLWLASDPIEVADVAAVEGKPGPEAARAVLAFLLAVRNQTTGAAAELARCRHACTAAAAPPAAVNGNPAMAAPTVPLPNPDVYLASSDAGDAWTCPTCLEPITWLEGGDQLGSLLADITAHRCPPAQDTTPASRN